MKNKISLHLAFAAATLALTLPASHAEDAALPAAVTEHIAKATAAAKTDQLGPLGLCKTATPQEGPSFMDSYNALQKEPPLEPMQVMDDLYFLGTRWSTAWALKTSAGLVIIDALDNSDEAQHYIEDGLRTLKLDPADIKYVIVSHAHGDHYGGAPYLKEKFNPRIVMSEIDWKVFEDPKFDPKRNPLFGPPPKRDMAVNDGDTITLGDSTLKLYVIPGHTLGTLATVFTVHDHGEAHRAVAWGGTAYNFGPLPDRLQIYADTAAKYHDILKQENADVLLSNHVFFDAAVAKMAALKDRKPNEPNPFVVGNDSVQRFLTILGECALATKAYVEAGQPGKKK
jgi:metallo-beta-lactamase class B